MTDPPDFARDEIASAHLDGEAVATDPTTLDDQLQARVEAFRTVSEALGAPVEALTDDQRTAMLAAALAAADGDAEPEAEAASRPVTPVTPIGAGRRGRRKVWLPPPAVAAAAILVIAIVGIGLIVHGQRDKPSTTLSAAADQSAKAGAADSAASTAAGDTALALPDLGTFADQAAIGPVLGSIDVSSLTNAPTTFGAESATAAPDPATSNAAGTGANATTTAPNAPTTPPNVPDASVPTTRALSDPDTTVPATNTVSGAAIDRCDAVVMSTDATLGDRLAVATARLGGRAVLVYSHPIKASEPPATRITVADAETCDIVLAVQR